MKAVQMIYPKLTGKKWRDAGPLFFCCFRCAKNYLWVLSDETTMKKDAKVCVVELPDDHDGICDRCDCQIGGEPVTEGGSA